MVYNMRYKEFKEEREWVQDSDRELVNPLPIIQNNDVFKMMDRVDGVLWSMGQDEQYIDKLKGSEIGKHIITQRAIEGTVEDVPISKIVSTEKYLNKEHVDSLRRNSSVVKSSSKTPLFYMKDDIYYAGDGNHRIVAKHLDGEKTIKGLVLDVDKILEYEDEYED